MSSTLSTLRCMMLIRRSKIQQDGKCIIHPASNSRNEFRRKWNKVISNATEERQRDLCDSVGDQELNPFYCDKYTQTSSLEMDEEESVFQLLVTYYHSLRDRSILLYPKLICTAFIIAMLSIVFYIVWKLCTMENLLVLSTGRFADFYCLVGLWVMLKFVTRCTKLAWIKCTSNDDVFKKAGSWAVVTGCTNGIGKEYALQLAAKGMNLILISRNAKLLDDLALEIGNDYGVRTMVIVMDFSVDSNAAYRSLARQLHCFDIGVLVNNVGISDDPHLFHEMDPQKVTDLIHVNMLSLAKMCRIVLPGMAMRRRGIVINLSSALGTHPVSFVSLYGASKRFVDVFSRSIETEYKSRSIIVQSVTPYFISTNMTKGVDTEFLIPDAKTYVASALATVGRETPTYGFWPHTLEAPYSHIYQTPLVVDGTAPSIEITIAVFEYLLHIDHNISPCMTGVGAVIRSLPSPLLYLVMKFMKYSSEKLDKRNAENHIT